MHTVLVVEADDHALRARGDELLLDGYEVLTAATDRQARLALAEGRPNVLVLGDLAQPAASLTLLRHLRSGEIPRADPRLPAITVGAGSEHVAIRHYEAGADIVLAASPSPLLIAGALGALGSRTAGEARRRRILRIGSLTIDCDARVATVDDSAVQLTRTEFDLLESLARDPYTVQTREQLVKEVWNTDFISGRSLDAHVGRVRSKLSAAGAEPLLQTVRGVGFRLGR